MRFKICFIDGHDLKYKVFKTEARSEDDAMDRFNERYGANFDHQFISIEEDRKLIEKFTPEELAQIRKELREKDRVSQKDRILAGDFRRAIKAIHFDQGKTEGGSFGIHEVKGALTLLVDHALNNYVVNDKRTDYKGRTMYKRNPLIPGEMEEKYQAAYKKLVDVLEEISEPWDHVESGQKV